MKRLTFPWWLGLVILGAWGYSPATGTVVADPLTMLLAGLTVAGILICEGSMQIRRPRPALLNIPSDPSRN